MVGSSVFLVLVLGDLVMFTKISEYNGNQTLQVMQHEEDEFAIVTMGSRKLAALVKVMPQVLNFLAEHGKEPGKKAIEEFYKSYHPVGIAPVVKELNQQNGNGNGGKKKVPTKA